MRTGQLRAIATRSVLPSAPLGPEGSTSIPAPEEPQEQPDGPWNEEGPGSRNAGLIET